MSDEDDSDMYVRPENAPVEPVPAEESVTESESATESDSPAPPAKKQKVHDTAKARGTAGTGTSTKVTEMKRKAADEKIVAASDDNDDDVEQTPKPKKMKVRDEINFAARKIEEDKVKGDKYGGMVESMFIDKRAEPGMPAPKAPSQLQVAGKGKKLKREGAIADINALYKGATPANPGSVSSKHQNDAKDNRFITFPITPMSPLLTLDELTLFYWTLSDTSHKKRKHASAIDEWSLTIPLAAKAASTSKSTSSRARSDVPSLTSGATSSRSYAPSTLSENVKIISHKSSDLVKVKSEPALTESIYYNGGLSDNDEIKGGERDVAVNSPPKGKKRITSEVFSFFLCLIQ